MSEFKVERGGKKRADEHEPIDKKKMHVCLAAQKKNYTCVGIGRMNDQK